LKEAIKFTVGDSNHNPVVKYKYARSFAIDMNGELFVGDGTSAEDIKDTINTKYLDAVINKISLSTDGNEREIGGSILNASERASRKSRQLKPPICIFKDLNFLTIDSMQEEYKKYGINFTRVLTEKGIDTPSSPSAEGDASESSKSSSQAVKTESGVVTVKDSLNSAISDSALTVSTEAGVITVKSINSSLEKEISERAGSIRRAFKQEEDPPYRKGTISTEAKTREKYSRDTKEPWRP
jgi:hypothetical protein